MLYPFLFFYTWLNLAVNCGETRAFVCEKLKTDAASTDLFVQPLSFGDGKPCPDGYSTYGGKTNFRI